MAGTEERSVSQRDVDMIKEHAVLEQKVDQLHDAIPEIFASLKDLRRAVGEIPMEIVACRDRMEREMKQYNHNAFITDRDLRDFEDDIKKLIDSEYSRTDARVLSIENKINRATWTWGGMLIMATVINYLIVHTPVLG